jgi:hypothetical protein
MSTVDLDPSLSQAAQRHETVGVVDPQRDRHQADFERALLRAEDECDIDDVVEADVLPAPALAFPVARMLSGDGPVPTSDPRIASGLPNLSPTHAATFLRTMAAPLAVDAAPQRLQVEITNPGAPLQHIELSRTSSGHVDLVLATTLHTGAALDTSVARLRVRLTGRGTALGHLQVKPFEPDDDFS